MRARDRKGYLITFEKTAEGLGGTTQAKLLVDELRKRGYDAVYSIEPGGTVLGTSIRETLLSPRSKEQELSHAAELFLYMADRAQHYKEVLKPSLTAGKIVVCDRYVDSTLVYQGAGRGWKTGFLLRLHQAATGALMPDLTFVLDGTTHRKVANDDRFEQLGEGFFRKIKTGMLRLAASDPRYVTLQVNHSVDAVAHDILTVVEERLPAKCLPKNT
jgi:dTMP kinase